MVGKAKDGMSVRKEDLLVQPNDPHGIERLLEYATIIDILHRVALAFRQVGVLFRSLQLQLRSLSIPHTPHHRTPRVSTTARLFKQQALIFSSSQRWLYQLRIGAREQLIKEVEIPFSHRRTHDARLLQQILITRKRETSALHAARRASERANEKKRTVRSAEAQMEPLSLENQISMNLPKRELLLLNRVRELPKACCAGGGGNRALEGRHRREREAEEARVPRAGVWTRALCERAEAAGLWFLLARPMWPTPWPPGSAAHTWSSPSFRHLWGGYTSANRHTPVHANKIW